MVQELSDADSSATHGSRSRTSAKRPDTSLSCMTGSNPSSDNCQDGKQAKTSGTSRTNRPKLPRPSGPPPQCPRCSADPSNTKFCYYNNYNINQPRYYCKACQRHWTDGGTLRKVETGAGKRNSRRARGNGSVTTSEAAAVVHNKYARVTRDVPQQNWPHENFMPHRAQSIPLVAGAGPTYFDTAMADHNSSDANVSFQEGSSFNPDKVILDEDIDTAQAMADLDVIFANDRLDAILGSAQPMPNEGDTSLGTMLGLEVLEDLANTYPSDTDFQQAMDGLAPPADSSKMLQGTTGSGPSGNLSGSQSEHMLRPPDSGGPNPATVSEPHILPSPTLRSPAPTPPPGVNVGAAFRNHGRPATDEPTPAQVMGNATSNLPAKVLHNMAATSSEDAAKAPQSFKTNTPASFKTDNPSDGGPRPGSSTPTRAPSEEATLATIVDQTGSQSMPRSNSWRDVQMGCASGGMYPDLGGSWQTPGAHMVAPQAGQPGVAMTPSAAGKYPAVSGAAITSGGMMAVPLGVHGNGQAYAMPPGGFQQFVAQPGRGPQQVQGGYYMPAQPMSGVRLRPTGRMQQQQVRQMAPGGYYIMHCDPQHAGGMPGMPANAAAAAAAQSQQQQARRSPRPMSQQQQHQQQQQQQKSPRAGGAGSAVQVMSTSLDGSGSMQNTSTQGTPQEQAAPNQMFSMDPSQQVVLRHQQMYPSAASDKSGVATAGAQQLQMPAGSLQGAPMGTQLVPVATAHSHMYISSQGDPAAAVQRAPAEQGGAAGAAPAAARNQAAAAGLSAASGSGTGMMGSQLQGSASACSSNPSAASSQSNAVYVDFRQGAVLPNSASHQPASPAAAQQQRQQAPHQPGQLRGPVFCVAPQWQHAGRPVYTLQQLQHHSAPVCYVQGGYMPRGSQPTMYQHPQTPGHRSPRDSTADQGSEEPEQDQHVLDATTAQ